MAIATVNPATGETLKTFEPLDDRQIEEKLQRSAEAAAKNRRRSFADRASRMRKAAEILEFVDTPKDEVRFTELGRKFIAADSDTRKEIFAEQVQKLRLFHIILGYLEVQEEIDSETVIKDISTALPYENAEKVLQTMIAWGRYAGLMDYDANTQMVTRPENEVEKEEEKKEEAGV